MRVRIKVLLFLVLHLVSVCISAKQIGVKSLAFLTTENQNKLIFDLTESAKHRVYVTDKPARLVIDINNAQLAKSISHPNLINPLFARVTTLTVNDTDLRVMIDYKEHALHKIIYLWNYGVYPEIIDHIDGNPLNNHIDNLRSVIHCQNMQNRKLPKNNTSGCKNVSFNKKYNKWQINIGFNKKRKIWFADDLELADLIAHEARNLYHKEYARHV